MVHVELVTVQKDSRQPIDSSGRVNQPAYSLAEDLRQLGDSSARFKTANRQFN